MLGFGETLWKDARYGARMLLHSPGFTTVAVLSLALGIGANTALFSVMDALVLRMLPVKNPQELVRLRSSLSFPAYQKIRDRNQTLAGFFGYSFFVTSVRPPGQEAGQATAQMVTGNYYSILGVTAAAGRLLSPDDDRTPGTGGAQGPVGVISYQYWQRRFSLDPKILGSAMIVNGIPITIVGVTSPRFTGVQQMFAPDLTVPIMLQPRVNPSSQTELWVHGDQGSMLNYDLSDNDGPQCVGRLKRGASMSQAQAELNVLYQQILVARAGGQLDEQRKKENAQLKIELQQGGNGSSNFEPQQLILLLIVTTAIPGVVLLIACANVANLLLARAAARQKEVAVRLAIGAGRFRLIRQFLTESLLLALLGGTIGLALATLGRRALLAWLTASLDFFSLQAETDSRVLVFTLAVSVIAALLFGLAPAFRASRPDLTPMLKEGARGVSGGRGWETGRILVGAQVALSLLLLVCAGLLIRTVRNLQLFDAGYNRENLYLVDTNFSGYPGPRHGALVKQIWDRMSSLPGARAVGITLNLLPYDRRLNITVEGYAQRSGDEMYADRLLVGPGFLETMGIPLLAGRTITPRDDENAPKICVVSVTMARAFFPNSNPIGRHFTFQRTGAEYEAEIVGVVKDVKRTQSPGSPGPWHAVYCPILQDLPLGGITLLVRTAGDPAPVISEVRRRFQNIDRNLFLHVQTEERFSDNSVFFFQRFLATLAGIFSLLALLLACVGLYGVMAYSVSRRTNEIGIRMALGADRGNVIIMVARETMRLVGIGMLVGLLAAWAATRAIASALFGLTAMDPFTIVSALLVMAAVALVSGYVPSRRAADVNPVEALRQE
jgi:predicted permease